MMYNVKVALRKSKKSGTTTERRLIVNASSVNEAQELTADYILRKYNSYFFDVKTCAALDESVTEVRS